MYDLENFLSGKLFVDCKNKAEVSAICELLREHGIDADWIASRSSGGIRVNIGRRLCGAYSSSGSEWHVRNGFTERWMPYAEFMDSCGLSVPQFSTISVDDFV